MDKISWNFIIAFYLFSAGVSAGALIVSLAADFTGNRRYDRIVKIGAFIAPFPLSLGTFALIFDLERPLSFWRLFTRFEASSVMSIGSWILLLFSLISAIIFYMHIPDRYDILKIKPWLTGGRLSKSIKTAGFVAAFATATYTGILLCVLTARPFWNTPLLPMVFLFSAIIDGIAAIGLISYLLPAGQTPPDEELVASKHFLAKLDMVFLVLLYISLSFLLMGFYQSTEHARNAVSVVMGGRFTVVFWLGVILIGMFFPLIYGLIEMLPSKPSSEIATQRPLVALLVSSSVLIGGFMLRYVVVYAGQLTGPILQ
jgi:formate-dependent nitrite reductase membrane component NrfD